MSFPQERPTNLTSAILRAIAGQTIVNHLGFFFFLPPPESFQSYSTSFHGRPAFNGELVAILMRVSFGHGTPVYSRPARPTVALLWRRHWKSCKHLSPTDTNQGNREKHSKHNDRLIMLGFTIDCLFFFLSHPFTYFFKGIFDPDC